LHRWLKGLLKNGKKPTGKVAFAIDGGQKVGVEAARAKM
jgi:hypothetical protein